MAGTLTVQNLQGPSSGANANKIIVPSGQTLDASNGFTPPAGHVVQVVEGSSGSYQSFNAASGWLTLTASITPKSSSSLVLVKVHIDGITREDNGASYGKLEIHRNRSSKLADFGYPMGWTSVDNASGTTAYGQVLDSPSTTSSTSYDIYWNALNIDGGSIQQFNRDGASHCRSSIVLMEVAQ